jgi:hypothetical protein
MRRVIYCLWTGTTPMSAARFSCFEQLRRTVGCEVKLLDKYSIQAYEVPGHPFHPAVPYLSETHRADYFRTYLMHFHGGGYSDVKRTTGKWTSCFEQMESNPEAWICGYKEIGPNGVAVGPENPELAVQWQHLVGNCAYICKPKTPLTTEWYEQMVALLDGRLGALRAHPAAHPRDSAPSPSGYPMGWADMLGCIFHRVSYKHKGHILNTLPTCEFHGYL